ncbi:hypothetical protein TBLA_0G00390 [Henningerozyma blattae CBS 6284]|uniref:Arf-GAP domain-containing protein n=1 Tax=Henningerozyma blattae (strain ATCC 34711 / CBS 6284 / DSM 70876 / NBRC 10599 / NRRL Y-10934 / UCD 77-7) TaxID=1071380 RepID=I2H6I6_HENB6|nr:hypothetical protein TBLA_0G00390 [Tetrapisispora blattae CBS 6284]CCH61988.1 hypothetical protein TBLA_0G00390 [Tetrapisispora blattae CBS 6284]
MSEWKIDPDNRRRLLQLQKIGANKRCVDCNAPNPQWASPKFGIFICLECAGTHRSLGVHISFVRSITMDQFKPEELVRMEKGGNEPFTEYMKSHGIDITLPQKFKYDNPIAQDYKEKLTCLIEDKEFVEPTHPEFDPSKLGKVAPVVYTTLNNANNNDKEQSSTPMESIISSKSTATPSQQLKNEAYFARLGEANQNRSTDLPPSQGGKYQGFGNTMPVNNSSTPNANSTVSLENFQKDPLGTFTKGWSLFSSAVSQSFDDLNQNVIKPKVDQWNSGELTEDTKRAANQFGQKFQETSSYGFEAFNSLSKNLQSQYYAYYNGDQQPSDTSRGGSNGYAQFEKEQNTSIPPQDGSNLKKSSKRQEPEEDEWEQF